MALFLLLIALILSITLANSNYKNGFPPLRPQIKEEIEQCIIDPFFAAEINCENNPYAGLVRFAFHDCGTYDATVGDGGCHAYMSQTCSTIDECEYTAQDNNGLQMWVDPINAMYNNAVLDGIPVSRYLSRADFFHLASFRALQKSSDFKLSVRYFAGRETATQPERFPNRLPNADDGWQAMLDVAHRNGMSDITAAALVGAHTLGACHPTTSGYEGTWDATEFKFDTEFYLNLLDLEWFIHTVNATNSQTGEHTSKQQFSLAPPLTEVSAMLFCDMGMHYDLNDSACNVENNDVAKGTCPLLTTPPELPDMLRLWADNTDAFFHSFLLAWDEMGTWGVPDLEFVPEYQGTVNCTTFYSHLCKPAYPPKPKISWDHAAHKHRRSHKIVQTVAPH